MSRSAASVLLRALRHLIGMVKPNIGGRFIAFNPLVNRLIGAVGKKVDDDTIEGHRTWFDLEDFNGRIVWLCGNNDWKITRCIATLTEPGGLLLDIGANYGTIGLAARHALRDRLEVHFFEPQPILAERLVAMVTDNQLGNVFVHPVALFDADGELEMNVPERHSGRASLLAASESGQPLASSIKIPVRRTRDYVASLVGDRAFGVKVDVEGAEPQILRDLLMFPGLRFVVLEGKRNQRVLYDMVAAADFDVYGLARRLLRPAARRVRDLETWNTYNDLVAVRRGLLGETEAFDIRLRPMPDLLEPPAGTSLR